MYTPDKKKPPDRKRHAENDRTTVH